MLGVILSVLLIEQAVDFEFGFEQATHQGQSIGYMIGEDLQVVSSVFRVSRNGRDVHSGNPVVTEGFNFVFQSNVAANVGDDLLIVLIVTYREGGVEKTRSSEVAYRIE